MRRFLIASAALAAFVLVPVASASAANTLSGSCTISGSATFTNLLGSAQGLTLTPQTLNYTFNGSGTCSGTVNNTPEVNSPATASASGSGTLSCGASESTGGTGNLTVMVNGTPTAVQFNNLDLVGTGTEVTFALQGANGGAGAGHATFASGAAGGTACNSSAGFNNVPFTIVAGAANLTG